MNTNKLKAYAPKARVAFMAAVEKRAATLGLYEDSIADMTVDGDSAVIEGRVFTRKQGQQRNQLVRRIKDLGTHNDKLALKDGFKQFINEIAFTWFNRLTAIRYMEVNEYLDHSFRVLTKAEGAEFGEGFEILGSAADVAEDLGLNKTEIVDMLLDGNKEEELYRAILLGQCHQLSQAMPLVFGKEGFEKLDDATELLLPDNLTKTDSILKDLVNDIPEDNWQQIEVIGWLYQFYISEHKDAVIGKVVKREDIPAATQLFTPNWIVKYLVQNSLGRQWLATYPDSELQDKMEYYITPAQQSDEVIEQLKAITPSSIDPEQIKVLDPACGSGHILVEVYEVLREIYIERGYRTREIPQLILTKNIYGLDIDDRAAQMAAFAVMMKAREDDSRIFSRDIKLNIHSMQSSEHLNIDKLWDDLNLEGKHKTGDVEDLFGSPSSVTPAQAGVQRLSKNSNVFTQYYELLKILKTAFIQAKDLGSLINVSTELDAKVSHILRDIAAKERELAKLDKSIKKAEGDLKLINQLEDEKQQLEAELFTLEGESQFYQQLTNNYFDLIASLQSILVEKQQATDAAAKEAASILLPFVEQAIILATKYDVAVANPPYMGSKGMNAALKDFAKVHYPNSKSDLFAIFMERVFKFLNEAGYNAQVNMQSWMFLSSFEKMRESLLDTKTFITMAHLGARAFGQISGEVVQTTAWVLNKKHVDGFQPSFLRLIQGNEEEKKQALLAKQNLFNETQQDDFKKIPGSPIAYWVSRGLRNKFIGESIGTNTVSDGQTKTGDNDKYLRQFWEVNFSKIGISKKWVKHPKGGSFRKWYGNVDWVIDWSETARNHYRKDRVARILPEYLWDKKGFCWTLITSGEQSFRFVDKDEIFNLAAPTLFPKNQEETYFFLAIANSPVGTFIAKIINPTLNMNVGEIQSIPVIRNEVQQLTSLSKDLTELSKSDWDSFEGSLDFKESPLVNENLFTIAGSYSRYYERNIKDVNLCREKEELLNQIILSEYDLDNELESEVHIQNISLLRNPAYRYASDSSVQEGFQSDTLSELVSYSIGNMMGRYSLDREGLVYAHSGNNGFKELVADGAYKTFPADDDGIVPLADEEWLFDDDATTRFKEFVKTVWGDEHLQENLDFVAESLCLDAIKPLSSKKGQGESSMATIRRYFSTQFYKDHLKTYKKRPIYWLFSSGKEKAFECLVYLHRYNEGTLSRMRTEYVTPLMGKLESRKGILEDSQATASNAEKRAIDKELKSIDKKQTELAAFDEELKHLAEMKISLNLDDGVKVNYGKFGNLLADVKAIHGKKPEGVK